MEPNIKLQCNSFSMMSLIFMLLCILYGRGRLHRIYSGADIFIRQFAEDQALILSYCRAAGENRKEAKENEHEIQFSYDKGRLH